MLRSLSISIVGSPSLIEVTSVLPISFPFLNVLSLKPILADDYMMFLRGPMAKLEIRLVLWHQMRFQLSFPQYQPRMWFTPILFNKFIIAKMKVFNQLSLHCIKYFATFRKPISRNKAIFMRLIQMIQIITILAPLDGEQPMKYDQVGLFWDFLNYVFRIDVLITEICGTGLATVIIFLTFNLLYWTLALLLTTYYRNAVSHSSGQ